MTEVSAPAKCCNLTKVEMVGSWTISINTDNCGICKADIKVTCIECVAAEADASNCTVAEGNCGHHFHTHCISRWTNSNRNGGGHNNSNNCPSCQQPWETAKVHSIAA
eukprot:GILI01020219.1.p1 GENE.GILI01020219.1~~GILI01020219.1.p1  ORF type:complete len:108 (+),score=16.80 GILI01020219.1:58-381(+)